MMFRKLIFFLILIQPVSCAKRYHPVQPQNRGFENIQYNDGIGLSYVYNLLALNDNKKYAKKERRKDIRLIAIKITNHNDFSINVRRDLQFYTYNTPIMPLEAQSTYNALKQTAFLYVLYGFIIIPTQTYNAGNPSNIWIPVGLPFAAWNMGLAFSANNKFRTELEIFNIQNRIIPPGESAVGLIGITDEDFPDLKVRLK